jgi:anti-anti-sigma factor
MSDADQFSQYRRTPQMTTRITQFDEEEQTIFKVEGTLDLADARLLTKVCLDDLKQHSRKIILDLEGVRYLNSASAAVLCCLKHQFGIAFRGASFFVQQILDLTEKSFTLVESNST